MPTATATSPTPISRRMPAGLLDPAYLAARRKLIDPERATPKAEPGNPPGLNGKKTGVDATEERPGTSHISIVDAAGNAVALTTTIESAFGSRLMAAGFLLNNQLTDFSFRPADAQGQPIANALERGKRPRSSMSPTIVLDRAGRLEAVLGSHRRQRHPAARGQDAGRHDRLEVRPTGRRRSRQLRQPQRPRSRSRNRWPARSPERNYGPWATRCAPRKHHPACTSSSAAATAHSKGLPTRAAKALPAASNLSPTSRLASQPQ